MGQANRRWQREDHRGNQSRHYAESEQHQGRNQVDKCGQRLHQIQHRTDQGVEPRTMRGRDSNRNSYER